MEVKTYFHFSRFILNDLIILIINLIVDCFLVSVIKANLRKKAENSNKLKEIEPSTADKMKNKEDNKKKVSIERKTNAMIIINISVYVVCRLPELLSVFLFFYFQRFGLGSCTSSTYCFLIANSIEYLYMLSY